MKIAQITLLLLLSFSIVSCKSDKKKIEEAQQIVESFVKDLKLENYNSAIKAYPSLSKLEKYWILNDFKITDSKIEGDFVTIYGTYKKSQNIEESIMFVLRPSHENKKYYIVKTKGLSAYFGSDIYMFLKNIGCLTDLETDEDIAIYIKKREYFFTNLVQTEKNNIQNSVIMESHNVMNSYGFLMGNITVKNTTEYSIPAFTYDVYIVFTDNNDNVVYKKKSILNGSDINPYGSISVYVNEQYVIGMTKVGIEFQLTNTSWLEHNIAINPSPELNCDDIVI